MHWIIAFCSTLLWTIKVSRHARILLGNFNGTQLCWVTESNPTADRWVVCVWFHTTLFLTQACSCRQRGASFHGWDKAISRDSFWLRLSQTTQPFNERLQIIFNFWYFDGRLCGTKNLCRRNSLFPFQIHFFSWIYSFSL